MPINLRVSADVVNIGQDTPSPSDIFLVDTNVWYWTAYSKASVSRSYKGDYDAYLKKVLRAGSRLYTCGLTQSELIHAIERAELSYFNNIQSTSVNPKEFRHNYPAERAGVVQEVGVAWSVVENIAEIVDLRVDKGLATRALGRFSTCQLDGYDLIYAEAMVEHGIPQVLTDDADFATVPGVLVFTANSNVIQAAAAQGRLVVR